MRHHIEAVSVNHNTALYMELMLRSLVARHGHILDLALTVMDNASEDDMSGLRAYAQRIGVPIVQSGFTTQTRYNSHGEVLSRFILDHVECTHYLLLDADVCFIEDHTLDCMLQELDDTDDAFGIMPRMSWDGTSEIPQEVRDSNPDLYAARIHPCCALIKNSELFRHVVAAVGLSEVSYRRAGGEEFVDTCKLMTRVMGTHGLRHILSSRMILHFFAVSYDWEHYRAERDSRRDARLMELRAQDCG
jgi:hypothetical protein